MKLELGDIVIFSAERMRLDAVLWEVAAFPAEKKVRITRLGGEYSEESYGHLLTLAEPIMQFFRYKHLPERLQEISLPFGNLAQSLIIMLHRSPERTVALRKLLEAKDAAVRAALYED